MTPLTPLLRLYLGLSRIAGGAYRIAHRRRIARGKEEASRIGERYGTASAARPAGRLVWIHAASVGESQSVLELIRRLIAAAPDIAVLVTTTTRSSAALLARDLPQRAAHQYAPIDTPAAARAFLDHWRPDVAVFTESELWPRLLHEIEARHIPALLINARVSAKTARHWRKLPRTAAALLSPFRHIYVQERATAEAMRAIGVQAERVTVTGSLKEELPPPEADAQALAALQTAIGTRPVWLAASTHEGEEEVLCAAQLRVLEQTPDCLMILAPRHPERGEAVAAILSAQGLRYARRSTGAGPDGQTQVYLADTLGEMGLWYRLAPRAFIGGSLVQIGGHNPYEPLRLGAAILTGPHVGNFAEIYARLTAAGGVVQAQSGPQIAAALTALEGTQARARQTRAAQDALGAGTPATDACLGAVLGALPDA
ncbi:MAG: 3-deoxy-D-manno-octulosonic acid transferase [Paracoccaceae bacterium]